MNTEHLGRVTTFEKAERGSLVRMAVGDTDHLGIKMFFGNEDAFLALAPGHGGGKAPGVIFGINSIQPNRTVYELIDARIRPHSVELCGSSEPGDITLCSDGR